MDIKMGVDPEFYVVDRATDKPVSAHTLVPGTKKDPHPLPRGGFVQSDGVAVEFNIPASSTAHEFANNIQNALTDLREMIPNQYKFVFKPYAKFDPDYFKDLPDNVKELGCDPDMNAYTGTFNRSPGEEFGNKPERVFGGHIHIGWGTDLKGDGHKRDCIHVIKQIESLGTPDYTYAMETVLLQDRRQRVYGSRGSFRMKPYGVEWRAPSNVWLNYGINNWTSIFTVIQAAVTNMKYGHASPLRTRMGTYHIPGRALGTFTA